VNKIVRENLLPGQPRSVWDIVPPAAYYDTSGLSAGDASIEGYATDISANAGQMIFFKVRTDPPTADYRIDIFRLGWYGGAGARLVATVYPDATLPQQQPVPRQDDATGLVDCGGWQLSARWQIPPDVTSGIYLGRLQRLDGVAGANHIVFIVRDDAGRSAILFQTSDTTWQAYNVYGCASLYRRPGHPAMRAYKVSYNRPFRTRVDDVRGIDFVKSWVFNAEYPMLRWLERNGYDLSYCAGVDTDRSGERLRTHRVFISVGHDEYWSRRQRANVQAARDAGVHLAFFSGNEMFWKIRWEPGADGTNYRTMVCYKESREGVKLDPRTDVWTGTWRDPRFSPPADGGHPENALTGTFFQVNNCYRLFPLTVSAEEGRMRFWRGTELPHQGAGQSVQLADGLLGWEWDCDVDNGARPAGLIRLSTTTVPDVPVLRDYGSAGAWDLKSATHHLTLYRHTSGALVFGAGTINWAWGLDHEHDLQRLDEAGGPRYPADPRVQQATRNLLEDMGVHPATPQPELRSVEAPLGPPPVARILEPRSGAALTMGEVVVVAGDAHSASGVIGAVEVSTDGGVRWHPAEGRSAWRYTWLPANTGYTQIACRAVDDAGQLQAQPDSVVVRVAAGAPAEMAPGRG
jgi:hypothetical protein